MYKPLLGVVRVPLALYYGLKVTGSENIPASGGAIVASIHVSWLDPFAVALAIDRPIHFMAKAELFNYPLLGGLLKSAHVFPVKRGLADRGAIRKGIEVVKGGELLGIFPEGTRSSGNGLLPLQGGAALIAMKAGVPILPVVVGNVKKPKFRQPFEVNIGKLIHFGGPKKVDKKDIIEASGEISRQFTELLRRKNH